MKLQLGKFYRSRAGDIWCCYRVRPEQPEHAAADCVRVNDGRVEYFYLDGRYDSAGKREHTLIKEHEVIEASAKLSSAMKTPRRKSA